MSITHRSFTFEVLLRINAKLFESGDQRMYAPVLFFFSLSVAYGSLLPLPKPKSFVPSVVS